MLPHHSPADHYPEEEEERFNRIVRPEYLLLLAFYIVATVRETSYPRTASIRKRIERTTSISVTSDHHPFNPMKSRCHTKTRFRQLDGLEELALGAAP
jgi:hypothetical protein